VIMPDELPGWAVAAGGTVFSAFVAAIGYVWTSRETIFKNQITSLEAEVAAGRLKIDQLQDKLLLAAVSQAEAARLQAETYQRLARSLEEQNTALKSVSQRIAA